MYREAHYTPKQMISKQLRLIFSVEKNPIALEQALRLSLTWAFWSSCVIGLPATLILYSFRLAAGDPLLYASVIPAVYFVGLLFIPLVSRRCSVEDTGAYLAGWLACIAIASQASGTAEWTVICWVIASVVGGFYVSFQYCTVLIALTSLAAFLLPAWSLASEQLFGLWISLISTMLGVSVAMRLLRQLLLEAMKREEDLCRQIAEIEERRRIAELGEQAMQHYAILGTVASGIAHDVNNALTVVIGNADLLTLGMSDEETFLCLRDMRNISETTAAFMKEILTFSSRRPCSPRSISPVAIVKRLARTLHRVLPDSIKISYEMNSTGSILMDPADLQRCLLNLIVNARDAMSSGGRILLSVVDATMKDASACVCIRVSDSGTGMSLDTQAHLFKPFFSTKPEGRGSGLGLKMVRQLVEEAGGCVEVSSEIGKGSEFRILMPTVEAAPDTENKEAQSGSVAGMHVLLVEDRSEVLHAMRRILERGGCRVECVESGTAAIRLIETGRAFDNLCIDSSIPGDPPAIVIQRFKVSNPNASVLVCSGSIQEKDLQAEIDRGHIPVLMKPFSMNGLLVAVGNSRFVAPKPT